LRVAWTLVLLIAAVPAGAEPPRRQMIEVVGASVNILGVQNTLDISWRWRLSQSTNPLLSDAHLAVGVTNDLSPAFMRVGGFVAWAPLSVLAVRAGVEPVYYFGIVGSLIGFPTQDAVFDEDARRALRPDAVSELGVRFHVAPTLQFRLGRVVAAGTVEFERWEVDGPDAFFYEPRRDTLLASGGDSLWRTSSLVLLESGSAARKLQVGLHHELQRVRDAPANDMQRLGPLVIWPLGDRLWGLAEPTLLANAYFYLEDPYKRHEVGATVGIRFVLGN
jgi:hypothetical protein